MDFLTLSKNLKKDYSSFQTYKIAFISDVATQFVVKALRGHAFEIQLNLQIYELGIGQGDTEIMNPDSGIYQFQPQTIIFYHSLAQLQPAFYKSSKNERLQFADNFIDRLTSQISVLIQKSTGSLMVGTIPEVADPVAGLSALTENDSLAYQVRKINNHIIKFCQETDRCEVLPVHSYVADTGYSNFYESPLFYSSNSDISFKTLPDFAGFLLKKIAFYAGKVKKCIITDLDNTLWGGVAGDDGWENLEIGNLGRGKVFTQFQYWLLELKNRGVILVVCSKNEESVAREVFIKHPDVILKLEDFALFVANWKNKPDNICHIRQTLNIGLDSIVFLDDNAAEREYVRQVFPELTVPDLPRDAAEWLPFLGRLNYFASGKPTEEDLGRTIKYQQQTLRTKELLQIKDLNSYLKSLQMQVKFEAVNPFTIPRAAQLTQRTNQFNLRNVRYSESDIQKLVKQGNYVGYVISLKDKFGDEGIVSFIFLEIGDKDLFIDTWVMSCRVFGRSLEYAAFNFILSQAQKLKLAVKAEYIPSVKNKYVETLLPLLGFEKTDSDLILYPEKAEVKTHFITII